MLALGAFVGAVSADWPVWSGDIYDIYITNPVPVGDGSEDLESFIIRAVNTTGNSGYGGYTGISGVLHQHRGPLDTPEPSITPAAFVDLINPIDTHFLIDATATVEIPLAESYLPITDTWPPGGDPADEGYSAETRYGYYGVTVFGDNLTGAFDIINAGPTWDIAQVVTNDRNSILLDFYLGGTYEFEGEYIHVLIPEPTALGLLALGGLALLRKRTK
jgi:hypothetical protein